MSDIDELIEKAIERFGPEVTEVLVRAPALLKDVVSGDIEYVQKTRHNLRHPITGKFRPNDDGTVTTKADGIPWRHGGNILPRLLGMSADKE